MSENTELSTVEVEAITKFEYNVIMLEEFVAEANALDRTDIVAVKDMHKKFVKIRTGIKSQEEAMVAGLNKQRQSIFDDRKQFLEITLPVETELKAVLDAEKERELIESRRASLPLKRKQLALLELETEPTDDELLAMDIGQWGVFYERLVDEREARIAKEKQDIIDAQEREAREAKIAEDARLAGIAEAKAEQERKDEAEAKKQKEAQAEKERQDKAEADRIERERLAKIADAKKLEADKAYQTFLTENNYNEITDRIVEKDGAVRVYRLVAEYQRFKEGDK